MVESPCKDCKGRHLTCHDHCEKYKTFRDEVRKEKEFNKNCGFGAMVAIESCIRRECERKNRGSLYGFHRKR